MKVAADKIRSLAKSRGMTLSTLLKEAGVSRNAYYTLARRSSVLPKSLQALARALEVSEQELLEEVPDRLARARRIYAEHPDGNFDNIWHTLTLLESDPIERLNRSLTRGRTAALHG